MELGAKPSPLDRLSMRGWLEQERFTFAVPQLVHQLRLPRRLRRAGTRYLGMGRQSTTSPRASRKKKVRLPGPKATVGSRGGCSKSSARYVRTGSMVTASRATGADFACRRRDRIHRRRVIFAAPTFLAPTYRRRAAQPKASSIFALADGESDARPRRRARADVETGLGQRDLRFAHARLRRRHAQSARYTHRSHGLDILLVAGAKARPRTIAACCSKRIGATGRKRFCTICSAPIPTFANACRASTSCAWATPWRGPSPGFMVSEERAALARSRRQSALRELRPKRLFHLRRSPVPGRARRRSSPANFTIASCRGFFIFCC